MTQATTTPTEAKPVAKPEEGSSCSTDKVKSADKDSSCSTDSTKKSGSCGG